MPHAEMKYSSDLELDSAAILAEIEAIILRHDSGAGACKGRAYPTDEYHHSHVTVSVSLLVKPHRDDAFSTTQRTGAGRECQGTAPLRVLIWIALLHAPLRDS